MGLFDFGASKNESSSRSESSARSFDNLDQFGFNFARDVSGSRGSSASRSRVAFEDVFQQLFGGASRAAGAVDTGALSGAANLLFSSGAGFIDSLAEGGEGAGFLRDRLAGGSGLADEQIDILGEDIAKFLAEDVNPAITSGGVSAGTLGGSRGDVRRGLASEAALREFRRGAVDIRRGEQTALDNIATTLAADEAGRFTTALGSLGDLFGLAESSAFATLSPFAALGQILGGPTVLTDSESSQLAESLGLSLGVDETTGRAGSSSRSTSRTDSSGASFSFGF